MMLPGDVPVELTTLDHLLMAELGYQRDALAVINPNSVGEAMQQFLRLAPLRTTPDPADTGLTFTSAPIANAKERWDVCLPVWLTGDGPPVVFVANAKSVFTVAYVVRAVTPGKYVLPQAYVEDMYNHSRYGRTGTGSVEVRPAK